MPIKDSLAHQVDPRLALAIRATKVALWDWDLRTNAIHFSPEWARQLGHEPHEVSDTFAEWEGRVHPEDLEHCLQQIKAYLAAPWEDYQLEFRMRHRDGSYRWIAASALCERDEQGRPVRMFGSHLDITEQRELKAAVTAFEQRRRATEEFAAHDSILVHDDQGRFIDANRVACERHGYSREELLALTVFDIEVDVDEAACRDAWARANAGDSFTSLGTHKTKDGSTFPVEVRLGAMMHDGKRLFVGFCRDISERVEAQGARKANQAKSEFIAGLSHEIRTPLNAIIGFAEALSVGMVGQLSDDQRKFVEQIHAAGKRLHALVNDALDLSKVEARKRDLKPTAQDVPALIESAVGLLKDRANSRRIEIHVECEAGFGPVQLDERSINQVLLNLLSNAVKFCNTDGSIVIRACRRTPDLLSLDSDWPLRIVGQPDAQADSMLEFSVTDTGPGLTPDQMEQLFEPFVQIKGVRSPEGEGTGLGLSLVRNLVEMQGGAVGVSSRPGRGSCFYVWLPLRATHDGTAPAGCAAPQGIARQPA